MTQRNPTEYHLLERRHCNILPRKSSVSDLGLLLPEIEVREICSQRTRDVLSHSQVGEVIRKLDSGEGRLVWPMNASAIK